MFASLNHKKVSSQLNSIFFKNKFDNIQSNKIVYSRIFNKTQKTDTLQFFMQTLPHINSLQKASFTRLKFVKQKKKKLKLIQKKDKQQKQTPGLLKLRRVTPTTLIRKNKAKRVKNIHISKQIQHEALVNLNQQKDQQSRHFRDKFKNVKPQFLYSEPTSLTKKKIYKILICIKKNNVIKAKIIINKIKNVLTPARKDKLQLLVQKNYFYKVYNRLYLKRLLIHNIKNKISVSLFKAQIKNYCKKKYFSKNTTGLNLTELIYLNRVAKLSVKIKRKKNIKILYKSLTKNINKKLGRVINTTKITQYAQLHKIFSRKLSNKLLKQYVRLKTSKTNIKLCKTAQVQLKLKLYKKIYTLSYLIKKVKKNKIVLKKK